MPRLRRPAVNAVRGVTVILSDAEPAKLRAALTLLAATAALGGRARLFLHEDAVALAAARDDPPGDARRRAAGQPDLRSLWDTALAMPVAVLACQAGLALTGLSLATLDPRLSASGMVGVLADLGEDRLLMM